jgi:hypothetical protein
MRRSQQGASRTAVALAYSPTHCCCCCCCCCWQLSCCWGSLAKSDVTACFCWLLQQQIAPDQPQALTSSSMPVTASSSLLYASCAFSVVSFCTASTNATHLQRHGTTALSVMHASAPCHRALTTIRNWLHQQCYDHIIKHVLG